MRGFFRLRRCDIPFVAAAVVLCALMTYAHAEPPTFPPCPPPPGNSPAGCKWISVSPAEEQSLVGQNNILDSAEWARRAELSATVAYWRQKLQSGYPGTVAPPPAPPAPPEKKP